MKKASVVAEKLDGMKLSRTAEIVQEGIEKTVRYYRFPREHCLRIPTNNPLERIMQEIRLRTSVVGRFPDGNLALMLIAARLRHIAGTNWG